MWFIVVIGLVGTDYLIKKIVLAHLSPGESWPVIPHVFHLTLVKNTGMAFGLFSDSPYFGFVIPTLIVLVIVTYHQKIHEGHLAKKISLAMIIAGALGNLADRILYGSVVDYLDFRIWPVFNLADSLICLGFGGIVLCTLFCSKSDR